ncbi:MAG: histidine ammonia-lyase [Planctomycetota bacterium]
MASKRTRRTTRPSEPQCVELDGVQLTRADVVAVALAGARVVLAPRALKRVRQAAEYVAAKARAGEVIYGVTTGFGKNADILLPDERAAVALQRNLIVSHAVCVGKPLAVEVVRAILVLRINTLLKGHSGIRVSTLELLAAMLNRGVHPVVPEKGSAGASGDLAPLSHIVLVMLGLGEAMVGEERLSGAEALRRAGLAAIELTYKEGLALINTTALMTGYAVLSLHRLERALKHADIAAALSLEAMAGRSDAFAAAVHALRPHPGQLATAANIRKLTKGSTCVDLPPECIPHRGGDWSFDTERGTPSGGKSQSPQDAYSIRCAPQVHGAVRDTMAHAVGVVDRELSAVTDNPILFPDRDLVISAGNFHGMPLALALAAVKNALAALASISERRINKLVDAATSDGLPYFLIANDSGTQSGLMIVQYTAAALVNELATRSHAAAVYSVPTCANVEDHVSMGANDARHAYEMLDDVEHVVALELLTAAQALDVRLRSLVGKFWPAPITAPGRAQLAKNLRRKIVPGAGTAETLAQIRARVAYLSVDRELRMDITAMTRLVRDDELVAAVERVVGALE